MGRMMPRRRDLYRRDMLMSQRMTWPVTWPKRRRWTRGWGAALSRTSTPPSVTGGSSSDPGVQRPVVEHDVELPESDEVELPLRSLVIEADGDDGLAAVTLTRRTAVIAEGPLQGADLTRARLLRAEHRGDGDPYATSTPWEARLEIDGLPATLYGDWLPLAWLGTLAGWPAPSP